MATESAAAAQNMAAFTFGDDELNFFKQYVDPAWAPASSTGQPDYASLAQDFTKEQNPLDQFSFDDFGSLLQPLSDQPAISTSDIFQPPPPQPAPLEPSLRSEANLAEFSSQSASPAASTPQGADDHDQASDSETDSDEEEFVATRKPSTSKGRGASRGGKRSATKPKPYPRVSDVVRDAPQHKSLDAKRPSASTELKGSIRSPDALDDDWRPTLEEYQKMSSKEKRQLRNKISARNFRVRRKEYITTLEGEVATRDQKLQEYRDELSSTKTENSELRKEIERLRKAILEGRGTNSIFEEPATPSTVPSTPATRTTRATRSSAPRANRNKDLPASGSAKGFWGGANALGGTTPVHTTLIPDFDIVSALSGKPRAPPLQENMNPLLNSLPHDTPKAVSQIGSFETFADTNNFTFKSLEAYRMQLWSKMARESGANLAARASIVSSSPTSSSSSPSSLSGSSWSNSLVGRASANVSPMHFAPPERTKSMEGELVPTPSQALLATSISQSIVSRLSGAFWDAFSGKSSSGVKLPAQVSSSGERVDLEKVRRVLEGKAVLQVVDVDGENLSDLDEKLQMMSLASSGRKSPTSRKIGVELEDSFKSLTISTARREPISVCTSSAIGIFKHPMRAGHSPAAVPSAHASVTGPTVTAQN